MRFILYGSFLAIGIVAAMIGRLVPLLQTDLQLNYGAAGLIFSAQSIGSMIILLAGGWLVHKLGTRIVLAIGIISFGVGLVLTALAAGFAAVLFGNVLIGVGMALMDIGVSTVCIDANPSGKGKALGLLHFFFGVGAVFGPLLALGLSQLPGGWRLAFGACAILPLILVICLIWVRLPPPVPATPAEKFAVYRKPLLWIGALALCVYCGVEWGVGAWFPSYWKIIPGAEAVDPAWPTSLFWLTFALGRILQGGRADKWGFQRFLIIATLTTLAVLVLWIVVPSPAATIAWVLIFGFLIAGIYPTVVALVSHRFPASAGQLAPVLSIFAAIGSLIWPPLVGTIADQVGMSVLPWTQLILTGLLAISFVAVFVSDRREAKRQEGNH